MFGSRFVAVLSVLSSFFNYLDGEERACCFPLIVSLMYVTLTHSNVDKWSAVCDCGICC